MRFNTHCHVFNLQSVFDPAAANILQRRMRHDAGLTTTETAIVMSILKSRITSGSADFGPLYALAPNKFAALKLALQKDMDAVTDDMVDELADDAIFTPLMMDILTQQQTADNFPDPLFEQQVEGTKRQTLRYPGRMLPFFAVNPFRYDFVNRTKKALQDEGFIGVKLYPSLGYSLDAPGMDVIMDYCNTNHIPMLMHCNHGGFKLDDTSTSFCDPAKWGLVNTTDGYLDTYRKLKICFAHFGGSEYFVNKDETGNLRDVLQEKSWTKTILDLMGAYPGRVFADLAYHAEALRPATSQDYFRSLSAILAEPKYRTQVLWGTDTWLVRMECTEGAYWANYWPGTMAQADFQQISEANPLAFLGFTNQDMTQYKPNIASLVRYVQANRASDTPVTPAAAPAPWIV